MSPESARTTAPNNRSPGGAGTPAGAHIDTLESSDAVRCYAVVPRESSAEALDVSPATIYRAVETGKLAAYKIGTGKGAVRIPGHAIPAYLDTCAQAATTAEGVA